MTKKPIFAAIAAVARVRSLFALWLLASTVLGAGAASANVIVGATTLPSYTDGPLKVSFDDHETLVTSIGGILQGTGILKSISGGINQTYGNAAAVTSTGLNGLFGSTHILTDVFTGFKLRTTVTAGGNTTLFFTGGVFNIYQLPGSNVPNTSTTATLAQAITNASAGTLFVQLTPQAQDSFGDTFITTINNTVLSNFSLAQGVAYLSATGGIAKTYFDTNTVSNSYLNQFADLQFGGRAQTTGCPNLRNGLRVCGSDDAFNVQVPEPLTLSLFGAGVGGVVAMRRRKKAKQA
jgi:PEP-CTERM motif